MFGADADLNSMTTSMLEEADERGLRINQEKDQSHHLKDIRYTENSTNFSSSDHLL
jgi:hypothetical protein